MKKNKNIENLNNHSKSLLRFAALLSTALFTTPYIAHADIVDGKYGTAQVWDSQRNPAYPAANQNFSLSGFDSPYSNLTGSQYTITSTQYVQFFYVNGPCNGNNVGLKLFNADGSLDTSTFANGIVSSGGAIWGLSPDGFLHDSAPGGYGTFVSNNQGYGSGDGRTYTPYTAKATCLELDAYVASQTPLANGQILGSNVNPVISGSPSTSVTENTAYTFTPSASDSDVADTLTYSITHLPSWASFDTTTGVLTGTPADGDAGIYTAIVISVADGNGGSASLAAFSITVINDNQLPVANAQSVSVIQNVALAIILSGSDADDDALSYVVSTAPVNGAITGIGSNITYTPNANFVGTDSFSFTANDSTGDSTPATVSITVEGDLDSDGIPDSTDSDIDGDGILNIVEGTGDTDSDGITDDRDTDTDNDGLLDSIEGISDVDSDGISNYKDIDSNGNGVPDSLENADYNHNGIIDALEVDAGVKTGLRGGGAIDFGGLLLLAGLTLTRVRRFKNIWVGLLLLVGVNAQAQDCNLKNSATTSECWYAGAGLGVSRLEPEATPSSNWRVSDKHSNAVGIFGGLMLTDHVFAELSYFDLGSSRLKNLNPAITQQPQLDYSVYGINAGYFLQPKDAHWNSFVKLGAQSLKVTNNSFANENNSSQITLGVGAQLRFEKQWFARLTLESFDKDARALTFSIGRDFGKTP